MIQKQNTAIFFQLSLWIQVKMTLVIYCQYNVVFRILAARQLGDTASTLYALCLHNRYAQCVQCRSRTAEFSELFLSSEYSRTHTVCVKPMNCRQFWNKQYYQLSSKPSSKHDNIGMAFEID
jgi:hypothetical protein